MVAESRIQSEALRRLIVAVIMLALLAGATTLAVALSNARLPPPLAPIQLGAFSLERPARWRIQPAGLKPQKGLGTSAAYIEGTAGRRLIIAELNYDQPVSPVHALDEFIAVQFPAPAAVTQSEFRRHGAICGMIAELEPNQPGLGWQFVATFTLDGRRHVALSLTGPAASAVESDFLLLNDIAAKIVDKRYDALSVANPITLGDAATITVPKGLSAFRLNEPDQPVPRYLLTAGGDFLTLELTPLPADFARSDSQQTRGRARPDGMIVPAFAPAATAASKTPAASAVSQQSLDKLDEMLVTVLRWRYRDLAGAFPTQPIMIGRNKEQVFFAVRAGEWKPLETWIEFLAVRLETGRGVLLDVTASPSVSQMSETAAFMIAQHLTPIVPKTPPPPLAPPAPETPSQPGKL